jgi:hypothetical protein
MLLPISFLAVDIAIFCKLTCRAPFVIVSLGTAREASLGCLDVFYYVLIANGVEVFIEFALMLLVCHCKAPQADDPVRVLNRDFMICIKGKILTAAATRFFMVRCSICRR